MADTKKTNPTPASVPDKINPNDYKDKVEHQGQAIIKDESGKVVEKFETIVTGGAMYDKNTGNILWDGHTGSGSISSDKYDKDYIPNGGNTGGTGIFIKKPTSSSSSSSSSNRYDPPYTPPPPPPKITWNEPVPTFRSELKKVNQYTYFFGVDDFSAKSAVLNETCCFITNYIHVGAMQDGEYIELDATYTVDKDSSIEFYILDGTNEIPIVPIKDKMISNEKIFQGLSTRFNIDNSVEPTIYYNGSPSTISLASAIEQKNGYTITYKPSSGYTYKPFHQDIKVKVILRSYAQDEYAPSVQSIRIRKYGGNALWK